MSRRGLVLALVGAAIAVTLAATLTGSAALGWLGVIVFAAAIAAYVFWRLGVRRGRVFDR